MTNVYFTSDTHYGHRGIIQHAPMRQKFRHPDDTIRITQKSTDLMDEEMIHRHNGVVKENDTVYHLGDFSFHNSEKSYEIFNRLNGNKILISGNHDSSGVRGLPWQDVRNYQEIRLGGCNIVLCHFPFAVWNKSHYGSLNLHGHSHGTFVGSTQQCDVGVDSWEFFPVNLEQIIKRMSLCLPHNNQDRHGRH